MNSWARHSLSIYVNNTGEEYMLYYVKLIPSRTVTYNGVHKKEFQRNYKHVYMIVGRNIPLQLSQLSLILVQLLIYFHRTNINQVSC